MAVISVERGDSALAVGMVLFVHSCRPPDDAHRRPACRPTDRRLLIVGGYFGAALLTFGMWGAAQQKTVWILQAVLFFRVCLSGVAMTARAAAIPALVGREDLRLANALLGLTWSVMFSVGLALGGLAAEYLSPSGAILHDAMTIVAAAVVASTLPALKPQIGEDGPQKWASPTCIALMIARRPS